MTALLGMFKWIEKLTPSTRSSPGKETALTFGKNTVVSDRKHGEIHQFGLNISQGREGLLRTVGGNMHHLCSRQWDHILQSMEETLTLLLREIWILPWLVMSLRGVVIGSWSPLSVASASIRRVCQVSSLNVRTCPWEGKQENAEIFTTSRISKKPQTLRRHEMKQGKVIHHTLLLWSSTKARAHLSPLRVCDAGEAQVALLPVGVDTVALELPQLKRSMKGLGVNLDGDGIDNNKHSLHDLLSKAIFTAKRRSPHVTTEAWQR